MDIPRIEGAHAGPDVGHSAGTGRIGLAADPSRSSSGVGETHADAFERQMADRRTDAGPHPGTSHSDRSRMLAIETSNRLSTLDVARSGDRAAIKAAAIGAYTHPDADVPTLRRALNDDLASGKAARRATLRAPSGAAVRVVQRALDGSHGINNDSRVRLALDAVPELQTASAPDTGLSRLKRVLTGTPRLHEPDAAPGLVSGPLIRTSTGERMAENFTPTKVQLDSGRYWVDSQAAREESATGTQWYLTPDASNLDDRGPTLIDGGTGRPIRHNFVPTNAQMDSGRYWVDNQTDHGAPDYYYVGDDFQRVLSGRPEPVAPERSTGLPAIPEEPEAS